MASVYGVKGNIIRQYLAIQRLTDELMDKLDNDDFGVTAAQTLSFISVDGQALVNSILDEDKETYGVTVENAQKVRKALEGYDGKDAVNKTKLEAEVRTS